MGQDHRDSHEREARGVGVGRKSIPAMLKSMESARRQVKRYGDALENKYGNLRLKRYAVVSLGFERIWWERV